MSQEVTARHGYERRKKTQEKVVDLPRADSHREIYGAKRVSDELWVDSYVELADEVLIPRLPVLDQVWRKTQRVMQPFMAHLHRVRNMRVDHPYADSPYFREAIDVPVLNNDNEVTFRHFFSHDTRLYGNKGEQWLEYDARKHQDAVCLAACESQLALKITDAVVKSTVKKAVRTVVSDHRKELLSQAHQETQGKKWEQLRFWSKQAQIRAHELIDQRLYARVMKKYQRVFVDVLVSSADESMELKIVLGKILILLRKANRSHLQSEFEKQKGDIAGLKAQAAELVTEIAAIAAEHLAESLSVDEIGLLDDVIEHFANEFVDQFGQKAEPVLRLSKDQAFDRAVVAYDEVQPYQEQINSLLDAVHQNLEAVQPQAGQAALHELVQIEGEILDWFFRHPDLRMMYEIFNSELIGKVNQKYLKKTGHFYLDTANRIFMLEHFERDEFIDGHRRYWYGHYMSDGHLFDKQLRLHLDNFNIQLRVAILTLGKHIRQGQVTEAHRQEFAQKVDAAERYIFDFFSALIEYYVVLLEELPQMHKDDPKHKEKVPQYQLELMQDINLLTGMVERYRERLTMGLDNLKEAMAGVIDHADQVKMRERIRKLQGPLRSFNRSSEGITRLMVGQDERKSEQTLGRKN